MSKLVISTRYNSKTGVQEFFSEGQASNPRVNAAKVNLSRGGSKFYRLDNLQAHNTDSPAHWNDGASIHSEEARRTYIERVIADIKAAQADAELEPATVIAEINGSAVFTDAEDIFESEEDEEFDEAA